MKRLILTTLFIAAAFVPNFVLGSEIKFRRGLRGRTRTPRRFASRRTGRGGRRLLSARRKTGPTSPFS